MASKSAAEPLTQKVGFIGAGKMAQAMVKGFINSGVVPTSNIMCSNRSPGVLQGLKAMGVNTTQVNSDVVKQCDVVFLAVKPYQITAVLQEVAGEVNTDRHVIVSIAAGVVIKAMEEVLPQGARVVRVMPNTPTAVQEGAAMVSGGSCVRPGDTSVVVQLMNSSGLCVEGAESLIDAVSAVSGSGPAYAFTAIDAMAEGGVKMGLPRDLSIQLAAQTLLGAAKMVLESGKHPAVLKDEVCSPGGSTIVAMATLERKGFRSCLIDAVEAACTRAKQLG